MNGSDSAMIEQSEDFVSRWAKIKRELMKSRHEVLKANGVSEPQFRLMEQQASEQLGEEEREVVEGLVYTSEHPSFLHKDSVQVGVTRRIHLKSNPSKEE